MVSERVRWPTGLSIASAAPASTGPLAAVIEEAFALWQDLTSESPPPAAGREPGDARRARAVRLLRAAEECATALGGPRHRSDVLLALVPAPARTAAGAAGFEALTPRETEVLRLLAEGWTDREIAARLGVSHRTATTHVTSILAKLDVASRTAAVARAIRAGLV